jgi:hypothetical protein
MADYPPPQRRRTRYRRRGHLRESTRTLTGKLVALALAGTIVIGGLIASQMAAGNDPALGPKAVAQAKRTAAKHSGAASSASSGTGSGSDPYSQSYGYGSGGYSGSGSGYSSGSSGYSSGSSGYPYTPPPVTSSTS